MSNEKLMPWGLNSKSIAPGTAKNIPENKLKAFNDGSMNIIKGTTKKEQEDIRKRKDQEEAIEVYKEFVESFENSQKGINKAWIKGGIVNSEKGEEKEDKTKGRLYKPVSKFDTKEEKPDRPNKPAPSGPQLWTPTPMEVKKKPVLSIEKRKTNLELFKEELKVIQEERNERRKLRRQANAAEKAEPPRKTRFESPPTPPEQIASGCSIGILPTANEIIMGGNIYENDPMTTNIYLGNLNPKMTEMQICEIFGKYGPLASVKIMWPRTDEEKARGRNCGFVAYMNRKDGDRAIENLQGKEYMDFEMKLGWGKPVLIPPHPIYIPASLHEISNPPPASGLPFNAQPKTEFAPNPNMDQQQILANAVVKVVIPTERQLVSTIHRVVEFVVREGPMFEAMIMNREIQNPMFRFLFENQSSAHIYYRWKLFSILQGDSPSSWRTKEFVMFRGGSVWKPPQINPFGQGMPEELIRLDKAMDDKPSLREQTPPSAGDDQKKNSLTNSQRDRLENMLRELTPSRENIGDVMVWCLEHADCAEEIVECICESLSILQTPIPKKIARLFLVSDILHNSSAKVPHASFFRRFFEAKLPETFKDIHDAYEKIESRLKAEQFKQKVMSCFLAWEDWVVYASDFLINLQNVFLGLVDNGKMQKDGDDDDDVDGIPLEDIDGFEMDAKPASPLFESATTSVIEPYVEDIDGEPLEEEKLKVAKPTFVPSKWETVDEAELEAQAMTVSKWDLLEKRNVAEDGISKYAYDDDDDGDDIDGIPMDENIGDRKHDGVSDSSSDKSEEGEWKVEKAVPPIETESKKEISEAKRAKLREIEVKVMKYQDELEMGKKSRKLELSIAQQVDIYRQKLLKKGEEDDECYSASSRVQSDSRREDGRSHKSYDSKPSWRDSKASSKEQDNLGKNSRERSRERDRSKKEERKWPGGSRSPVREKIRDANILVGYDESPAHSSSSHVDEEYSSKRKKHKSPRKRSNSHSPPKRLRNSRSRSTSRHKQKKAKK